MPIGAVIATAGVGLISSSNQADASEQAGQDTSDATKYAADLQHQQYEQTLALEMPNYRTGEAALAQYADLLGLPGDSLVSGSSAGSQTPSNAALYSEIENQPGYQDQLTQGLNAVQGSAAAAGSLRSGATLKALNNYGQQTFGNYYNNFLGKLGTLAGLGSSTASNLASSGAQEASSVGSLAVTGANALGTAGVNAANAWSSGLGGALGSLSGGYNYYGGSSPSFNNGDYYYTGPAVTGYGGGG